jgi:hypothetical protein
MMGIMICASFISLAVTLSKVLSLEIFFLIILAKGTGKAMLET